MDKVKYTLFDRLRVPVYDDTRHMRFGELAIESGRCRECGVCVTVCPGACLVTDTASKMGLMTGTVKKGKYGMPRLALSRTGAAYCLACFDCGAACPHGAITLKGGCDPGFRFKRLTQAPEMTYPKHY